MEDYIYIGRVANTHGVTGTLKVLPTTDDMTRFELLKTVLIEDAKGVTQSYTVKGVKYMNRFVLLTLKEVTDMDGAMRLKLGIIKVPKSEALPLKSDEYYISDLVGINVYEEGDKLIGPLVDIIFTGSNEVYVVQDGSANGLLLPAIKDCILKVDVAAGRMDVHVMEGLRS